MNPKNQIALWLTGVGLLAAVISTGCRKEKESSDEDFATEAQDISQSEDISTSIDNMVTEVFNSKSGSVDGRFNNPQAGEFSNCATITWDSANSTITIYFNHCRGRNGHMRDGTIIIAYTGSDYWSMGTAWDVTFDNFYIDDKQVTGSRHVENVGPESNGCTWNIVASLTFTRSDGSYRSWTSTRTREITQGYRDTVWTNHIYKIDGTATHSDSRTGNTADLTFTDIVRDLSCAYITAGTITVVPGNNRPQRRIDFGNGSCDDIAVVTKNGHSRIIHLDGGH